MSGREAWETSERAEYEEWEISRAEAEYFAHVEGLPTFTHRTLQPILVSNEPIDLGESPF